MVYLLHAQMAGALSDNVVVKKLNASPNTPVKLLQSERDVISKNGLPTGSSRFDTIKISSKSSSSGSIDKLTTTMSPTLIAHRNHAASGLAASPGFNTNDSSKLNLRMDGLSLNGSKMRSFPDISLYAKHIVAVPQVILKNKKTLEEESKVLSLDWCRSGKYLVISLQNGYLCVWDIVGKERVLGIQTACSWVFTVAFSPSTSFIAAGGLDSKCILYRLPRDKNNTVENRHVAQHQSYVLACSFTTSDHQILTASSDRTSALWDVESAHLIKDFKGHLSDVTCLDFQKLSDHSFVTGSDDQTVKVWDIRLGKCTQTFQTHTGEVNQVRFFPSGDAVASVSDDMTARLYDLRMGTEIAVYKRKSIYFPACSLDFSLNGRLLFAGYGDHSFHVWDTLKTSHCGSVYSHENKVNALKLSPDGSCLATGSWDQTVKLWS